MQHVMVEGSCFFCGEIEGTLKKCINDEPKTERDALRAAIISALAEDKYHGPLAWHQLALAVSEGVTILTYGVLEGDYLLHVTARTHNGQCLTNTFLLVAPSGIKEEVGRWTECSTDDEGFTITFKIYTKAVPYIDLVSMALKFLLKETTMRSQAPYQHTLDRIDELLKHWKTYHVVHMPTVSTGDPKSTVVPPPVVPDQPKEAHQPCLAANVQPA